MAIDAKDTCACAVLFRSFAIQMPTRLTFPKVDFDTPNVHVTGLGRFQDVRLEESVVAWGRLLCLWFPFDERLQSGKYRGQVRVRRCVHTLWVSRYSYLLFTWPQDERVFRKAALCTAGQHNKQRKAFTRHSDLGRITNGVDEGTDRNGSL